jgi:hypothetical protein
VKVTVRTKRGGHYDLELNAEDLEQLTHDFTTSIARVVKLQTVDGTVVYLLRDQVVAVEVDPA